VIYVLAGGKYRNYAADGKTTEGELKTGDIREPKRRAPWVFWLIHKDLFWVSRFSQAKKRRAPSFPKAPFIVSMAISRILSPEFLRDDDHLS
jgi:hypothetical protein